MIDLKAAVSRIEGLLAQETVQATTYAALEARLTIEAICYDRLKIAHEYIAHDDLRRWQPKDIVLTLIQEVDEKIASTATLSISAKPAEKQSGPSTAEDYKGIEWLELGTQVGFDPKTLGSLWQALSGLALHVTLPKSKVSPVSFYGDEKRIRAKVNEALIEIKRISDGTMLMGGIGPGVSIKCECGRTIRRRLNLLKAGQVISCVSPECSESYEVSFENGDTNFARRTTEFKCTSCDEPLGVITKKIEKLRQGSALVVKCKCDAETIIAWRPMMAKRPRKDA